MNCKDKRGFENNAIHVKMERIGDSIEFYVDGCCVATLFDGDSKIIFDELAYSPAILDSLPKDFIKSEFKRIGLGVYEARQEKQKESWKNEETYETYCGGFDWRKKERHFFIEDNFNLETEPTGNYVSCTPEGALCPELHTIFLWDGGFKE